MRNFVLAMAAVLLTCPYLSASLDLTLGCGLPQGTGRRTRLVIVVPALGQTTNTKEWIATIGKLQQIPGYSAEQADWLCVNHNLSWFSLADVGSRARDLEAIINEQWMALGGYQDVVLVGHSVGALLIREAFLIGSGVDSTPSGSRSEWAGKVNRIVLFAGINRGIDDQELLSRRILAWALRNIPHPHLIVEDILRGSDFVTNLRIGWIRYFRGPSDGHVYPVTIQLRGEEDERVNDDDSQDILAFPNAQAFRVANAGHGDVYRMPSEDSAANARFALFRTAFTIAPQKSSGSPPEQFVTRVVFLLHGIRAAVTDDWIQNATAAIETKFPGTVVIHPEYGYLSAARFALPGARRSYIRAFQDAYTEALAKYSHAGSFDVVAHSNGTYIIGHSLENIPNIKFGNVVLVGSVLPTDYDWGARLQAKQVSAVRNDRSDKDWPVGLLCSGLRGLFMRDIGTGGYDGFIGSDVGPVSEVAYYPATLAAAHGWALQNNLDGIVQFLIYGKVLPSSALVHEPNQIFHVMSRALPYFVFFTVLGLLALGIWLAVRLKRPFLVASFAAGICLLVFILLDII